MNKNPYSVLGVNENDTDDKIKSAYRTLAKKYHPDNYQDSPLKDLATEKMQEINEAYDEIQRLRKEGRSYSSNQSNGGYSSYSGHQQSYTQTRFPHVRSLIQSGRLDEAENELRNTPDALRDAEWHFLYGMVYYRRGWTDRAYGFFRTAYEKEPNNPEFRGAFDRMNTQRNYTSPEYTRTYSNAGCSTCDICSAICCADACCECMGGDCIPCC